MNRSAGQRRVVWVTGAGSGMGEAAARAAAADGWTVVLGGRRAERLERVAAEIEERGGRAMVLPLDVQDQDAVAVARDRVLEEQGRIDALVLAAGLNDPQRRWDDQSMASFRAIVDTDLTGVAAVVDAALPALRDTGGVVVVVSSYSGWTFQPGAGVAYSAAKTGLSSLVRTLNQQEAPHGVRATHLCPGDVATDFLDLRPEVPDQDARDVMLSPRDVARAVEFVLDAPAHMRVDELVISPVSQR